MNKKIYIYALCDNSGIRYIGKADNIKQRFKCHFWEAYNPNQKEYNLRKSRWLRKYVSEIKCITIEVCTSENWQEREKYWINIFGSKLVNSSKGGNGGSGPKSDITKEKLRNHAIGRKASIETKLKMSISQKNAVKNGKKQHLKFFNKGIGNPRAYPIIQRDLNGNFIKQWEYAKLASRELKINYTQIIECVNNNAKTSGGFLWEKA
jgi:group I intron endonuclease